MEGDLTLSPLNRLFHSKVEAFHHNRLLGIPWNFRLEYFPAYCPFNDYRADSSLTMEDHQNLEEFRTRVEAKSTEAGSGGYGIGEDFHDGEKDYFRQKYFFNQMQTRCLQPNKMMEKRVISVEFVMKSSRGQRNYGDTSELTQGKNPSAVPCVARAFRSMEPCRDMN
ncbi:unnamed protein product [Cyprideis torosa]|uniref:Uncharacterized protein n=1 Tax=Cyprideis torosa TaxID=163714 RepID=A0A7R8ZPI2_9CRUS|nr:unnamed protein product [Cyprideis torosa]CAG0898936.1 unnamed protein product [Cyprideis torosa]